MPRKTRVREHSRSNAGKVREHERALAVDPRDQYAAAMQRKMTTMHGQPGMYMLNDLGPYPGVDTGGWGVGGFDVPAFDEATTDRILRDIEDTEGVLVSNNFRFKYRKERGADGRPIYWVRDWEADDVDAYYLKPNAQGHYTVGEGSYVWSRKRDA
jgi:hypothetical protein